MIANSVFWCNGGIPSQRNVTGNGMQGMFFFTCILFMFTELLLLLLWLFPPTQRPLPVMHTYPPMAQGDKFSLSWNPATEIKRGVVGRVEKTE